MNGKTYKDEQDQWDKMTKACLEASAEILGYEEKKRKTKTTTDPEFKALSDNQTNQKKLRIKINAAKTSSQKEYLKKKRNKQMKKIEKKLQEIQEQKITENIKEIEQCKDDSNIDVQCNKKL